MCPSQRIKETAFDNKSVNSGKLKYCIGGVGGDAECNLQMMLDEASPLGTAITTKGDPSSVVTELPFNTLKIRLASQGSITGAIEVCKRARRLRLALAISVCSDEDPLGSAAADSIVADFAVGVGAGQFLGGGLASGVFCAHYNRLIAIEQQQQQQTAAAADSVIRYVGNVFRPVIKR